MEEGLRPPGRPGLRLAWNVKDPGLSDRAPAGSSGYALGYSLRAASYAAHSSRSVKTVPSPAT